jgi:hypothetical protein
VVFSSHLLHEVELMADYAAVMDGSRLRVAGSLESIAAAFCLYRLTFAPGSAPATIPGMPGLVNTKRSGDTLLLTCCRPERSEGPSFADDIAAAIASLSPLSVQERPVSFADAVVSYLSPADESRNIFTNAMETVAGGV